MNKRIILGFFTLIIFFQIYTFKTIMDLRHQIYNLTYQIQDMQSSVKSSIHNIQGNIDKKLEEEASLFVSASAEEGMVDTETFMIPLAYEIIPKIITDTMKVSLDFDGELVQLEKEGMSYKITRNFKIGDNISPIIVIEDQDIRQVEKNKSLEIRSLGLDYLPKFKATYSGGTSHGQNSEIFNIDAEIEISYSPSKKGYSIIDMKEVYKLDNTVIKEEDLFGDKHHESGGMTKFIKEEFNVKKGQKLFLYIQTTDELGFQHEKLIHRFTNDVEDDWLPYFEEETITAPNGEVIYKIDENSYRSTN